MKTYPILTLRRGKEQAVKRFHPWIFSGAIYNKSEEPKDGDTVFVNDAKGNTIATGHYHNGSICVRVLEFGERIIDQAFWDEKISAAFNKRQALLLDDDKTDSFRLVHAEGDGLPGLIIDLYGKVAVVQCHSIGMHKDIESIANSIKSHSNGKIEFVFDKSEAVLPKNYASSIKNAYIGEALSETGINIKENGQLFYVDWAKGQKTGFFLDQRDNRELLGQYSKGKTVLNTFCYSGGFSIYALNNGAELVHSVDVSEKAMDWTDKNVALNNTKQGKHISYTQDVMAFLKENNQEYDVVVVDPPAFAKNMRKRHNALQGYKRLNELALKRVKSGGILFTFSCSQVMDPYLFQNTIVAAALDLGKKVSILHRLSQPSDHPVSIFHPEGSYLKGLVLYVE